MMQRVMAAVGLLLSIGAGAHAQERLALLIGNERYPAEVGSLNNPHEDVDAVAAALRQVGFAGTHIRVLKDADRDATLRAVRGFRTDLSDAGAQAVGFFYYSGHGGSFERRGFRENYLIPAGADVTVASDLPLLGVSLSGIIDSLGSTSARAVFVVSDACRNSLPFEKGGATADKGFVPEPARPGLFIAHATAEGSTAPDDGLFARVLANNLPRAGVYAPRAFELAFRELGGRRATYRLPTVSNALRDDFCFVSCPGAGPPSCAVASDIAASESRPYLQGVMAAGGACGPLARARLAAIARQEPAPASLPDARRLASGTRAPVLEDASQLEDFTTFRDCADCPEMVVLPSGSFTMGSPSNEAGRDGDEGPQRRVTIDYRFAVGRFEVTFDEWDACVADGYCRAVTYDFGWGRGRRPVMNVSWNDITGNAGDGKRGFLAWMNSKMEGSPYRLLSEAEWEYAARGGTTSAYSTGATITTAQANFRGDNYLQQTVPVGGYEANRFGLFDVHGNVYEWVQDCYQNSYAGAPSNGAARETCGDDRRVVRGGSWSVYPQNLRSAFRFFGYPAYRYYDYGFRLARTIPR